MSMRIHHCITFATLMVVAFMLMAAPLRAHAADEPKFESKGVCTDFASLKTKMEEPEKQILTNITNYVKGVINDASQNLYNAFIKSSNYQAAVNAVMVLMVVIYGVGFTIGVVQPSFGQALIRVMKMAIIYAMISADGGWEFFSQYAVKFFNDGTDQIIGQVMTIGAGGTYNPGDSPFKQLDGLASFVLSPDMIVAIMGSTFASGPYGFIMGGLLGMAVFGLLKLILKGLQTYALSFIVRALLLGVAPIFIVFLLFDRTKQLFTGWLNALINLSLQPILYFTFISFFIVMLQTSATDMLGGAELCWGEYQSSVGTQNKVSFWRFMTKDGKMDLTTYDWKGPLSCQLSGKTDCPAFPINLVDILSFLILVYVAQRFSSVIERISSEISNAFINLDKNMRMDFQAQKSAAAESPNKSAGAATTTARKGL